MAFDILVCASGRGSNLEALIAAFPPSDAFAQVACVLSDVPDAGALRLAERFGIASSCIARGDYASRLAFETALSAAIDAATPDLICLAGFMRVLSPWFCDRYAGRLLNIHPSLLPAFKGLNTHARALAAGVSEAGCTVHRVSAQVDAGEILAQTRVPVLHDDTAETLAARVLAAEHVLYPETVRRVLQGLL